MYIRNMTSRASIITTMVNNMTNKKNQTELVALGELFKDFFGGLPNPEEEDHATPVERTFSLKEALDLSEKMESDPFYSRTWLGVTFWQVYSPSLQVTGDGSVTFHLGDGEGGYMRMRRDDKGQLVFTSFLKRKSRIPDEDEYFAAVVGSLMKPDGQIDLNVFADYFSLDIKKGDYENIFYQVT